MCQIHSAFRHFPVEVDLLEAKSNFTRDDALTVVKPTTTPSPDSAHANAPHADQPEMTRFCLEDPLRSLDMLFAEDEGENEKNTDNDSPRTLKRKFPLTTCKKTF